MPQVDDDTSSVSVANEKLRPSSGSENGSQEPPASEREQTPCYIVEKAEAVRRACDLRDFDALVSYAISEGGFLRDDIRQLACTWSICPNMAPTLMYDRADSFAVQPGQAT